MATLFLSGPTIPTVTALPDAADNASRLLVMSDQLYFSDGVQWIVVGSYSVVQVEQQNGAFVAMMSDQYTHNALDEIKGLLGQLVEQTA